MPIRNVLPWLKKLGRGKGASRLLYGLLELLILFTSVSAFAQSASDTANAALTGVFTASQLNSIVFVEGVKYPRTDAGVNQAISELLRTSSTGGIVYLTPGTYSIANNVRISSSDVRLLCAGGPVSFNTSQGSCRFNWTGSAGGTVITVDTANTSGIGGDALDGITVNCAASAGTGIKIYSEEEGSFKNLQVFDCTNFGIDLGVDPSIAGLSGLNSVNNFENINVFTARVPGMVAWRLTGTSEYDTAGNTFVNVSGTGGTRSGEGFRLENADNDRWFLVNAAAQGSGVAFHFACMPTASSQNMCAREEEVFGLNTGPNGIKQDGAGSYFATANDIYGLELCNGTPTPTASTVGTGTMRITLMDCGGTNHRSQFWTNSGGNLQEYNSTVANKKLSILFTPFGLSPFELGTDAAGSFSIYDGKNALPRFSARYGPNGDTTIASPGSGAVLVTNNGLTARAAQVIAASTSTLTGSTISAGACAPVVTTPAPNVTTADSISWSYSASPETVDGKLILSAYPTMGDVNFKLCNPTAGSLTPSGLRVNWKVVR